MTWLDSKPLSKGVQSLRCSYWAQGQELFTNMKWRNYGGKGLTEANQGSARKIPSRQSWGERWEGARNVVEYGFSEWDVFRNDDLERGEKKTLVALLDDSEPLLEGPAEYAKR